MKIDVDFSLALNDRTGKLFLGRDILAALGDRVSAVRYGRLHHIPSKDLLRRISGRLTYDETRHRASGSPLTAMLPLIRDANPTLHLDPLSVVRHRLKPSDAVLCHDVGPITHPQFFARGIEALYICAYGKIRAAKPHMVFVSKSSQREFHRLYGEDYASSTVIYIPTRLGVQCGEEHRPEGMDGPFLITVGSIGDRKNQRRSIEAFAASGLADKGWRYAVVGGPEPGADAVIQLAESTPGVVRLGYVTDSELRWLYRNASGFVLMSFLEGFGMPVIEATEHDLPCLVSRSGILSEVGGDATLQADPDDVASISEGMRRLAEMGADERVRRISQARAHIRTFEREPILDQWREFAARVAGIQPKAR